MVDKLTCKARDLLNLVVGQGVLLVALSLRKLGLHESARRWAVRATRERFL
jgi:hypothetical protein